MAQNKIKLYHDVGLSQRVKKHKLTRLLLDWKNATLSICELWVLQYVLGRLCFEVLTSAVAVMSRLMHTSLKMGGASTTAGNLERTW